MVQSMENYKFDLRVRRLRDPFLQQNISTEMRVWVVFLQRSLTGLKFISQKCIILLLKSNINIFLWYLIITHTGSVSSSSYTLSTPESNLSIKKTTRMMRLLIIILNSFKHHLLLYLSSNHQIKSFLTKI